MQKVTHANFKNSNTICLTERLMGDTLYSKFKNCVEDTQNTFKVLVKITVPN